MSLLQFSYNSIAGSNIRLPAHKVHCENRPTGEEEVEKKLEMVNRSLIRKLLVQVTYCSRSICCLTAITPKTSSIVTNCYGT